MAYQPKDTLKGSLYAGALGTAVGLFFASVKNAVTRQNVGAWGVFTKFGRTIVITGAVGTTYTFGKLSAANLREKDDLFNTAIGGFVAGCGIGLSRGSMPAVLGWGAGTAILLGVFEGTGGLTGNKMLPPLGMDDFEVKQRLRANVRRPLQETIDELGEGRGIFPPGYQERRAARIKKNHGIDVVVK